jgi:L,D-transpeptidase catalytic domain
MLPKPNSGIRAPFLRALLLLTTLVVAPSAPTSAVDRLRALPAASASPSGPALRLSTGTIDANVFGLAFGAASCAVHAGAVTNPSTLTIIDYSKPSTAKRLWVFDLRTRELLYQELVAHGQGSGDNFATLFSNEPETHRSSLGLFVTQDTYTGKNGYSLRLNGLDTGFNDRARERAIVMHGAPYVSAELARTQGRLGRSWGCPALSDDIARTVIGRIKDGGLVFAYYPDQAWLRASKYLGGCTAAHGSTGLPPPAPQA